MKRFKLASSVIILAIAVGLGSAGQSVSRSVKGVVFLDMNANKIHDEEEPGIPNVLVSNGKEVVQTDGKGHYTLPAYDEMIVFITKPAGFTPPLNEHNVPQFFYIHRPDGSPLAIEQFPGIPPTGPLPAKVDFPLYREHDSKNFKAIVTGDTQVYTDKEISYLRDSFVKEVSNTDASLVIFMGDNIGDDLSLYPRFLKVISSIGRPIWLVPGNHDANLTDAPDPEHAFETFLREFGPTYYSFDYGDVHFVVLNDIVYPSPLFLPDRTYHGEIWGSQMQWLANDLNHVPQEKLIVLNMHIPIVSDLDRFAPKHHVANRVALYDLLKSRKAVALGGHTHTLGHFQPGEVHPGWGQPTPIPQVIVGASCGSWWSGDLDHNGIPMSYQRDGAPRGYMVWSFKGSDYNDQFQASGRDPSEQMHLSFYTPPWRNWFSQMSAYANINLPRPGNPPVTLHDLPDQGVLRKQDLSEILLVANVWNSSRDSKVTCEFDREWKFDAKRETNIGDPYAQRLQSYVLRYAMGFQMFGATVALPGTPPQPIDGRILMKESSHVWTCPVPAGLTIGVHDVVVSTIDVKGNHYSQRLVFEVQP